MARNRTTPDDQLPTLGSIAGPPVCPTHAVDLKNDAYLREHGRRYQIIYTTDDLAAFVVTYGPGVIFIEWQMRRRCSVCGSAKTKFVLSGHKTPAERWREED